MLWLEQTLQYQYKQAVLYIQSNKCSNKIYIIVNLLLNGIELFYKVVFRLGFDKMGKSRLKRLDQTMQYILCGNIRRKYVLTQYILKACQLFIQFI